MQASGGKSISLVTSQCIPTWLCPLREVDPPLLHLKQAFLAKLNKYEQLHTGSATLDLRNCRKLHGTLTLFELGWILVDIMIHMMVQAIIYTSVGLVV